jgi:DNA-binding transcriptional ArsR family regulator/DNA-binding PadR family transcriptional regulator
MTCQYAIADVAALVGEPSRAAILLALVDGRALPAGELARHAALSPAAASLHLAKLVDGGFLRVRKEGRHRLYCLASPDVAHALEALGVLATRSPPLHSISPARAALRTARTCYDHLAGQLAVAWALRLESDGVIATRDERNYVVTPEGVTWFARELKLDVAALPARRSFAKRCPDWTERRPHVAGALGAAMLQRLIEFNWLARTKRPRELSLTARGAQRFAQLLQAPLEASAPLEQGAANGRADLFGQRGIVDGSRQ